MVLIVVARIIELMLYSNSFLIQVRRMAEDTGLDFTDQIYALEAKYQQVNSSDSYKRYFVVQVCVFIKIYVSLN